MAEGEQLETMRPNPAWDPVSYEDAVSTFAAHRDGLTVKVWCGDWCPDCRSQLPDFAAALAAAELPDEQVDQFPVEKADDGSKRGPDVDAYGIERIPTVVIEIDGDEVARFVESADVPIAVFLADRLDGLA